MTMRKLILCLVAMMSPPAWADDLCTHNPVEVDVCQVATNLSEVIAQALPLRLTQSLVLEHIDATNNMIGMQAVFDYPEARLVEHAKGVPLDTMKKSVRDIAIAMVCRPRTELEGFILMGGTLQFVYLFSDRAHFLTVYVDHCGLPPEASAP